MGTNNSNQNEKIPWFDFCNWYSPKTKIRIVLVNERNFSDSSISTMSRNRFKLIQRYLHFNDNNTAGTNEDRLYKIHTILDIVVNNFRTNFIPDREISLDEGTLGWQGHLRFHVYNPSKITKYSILVWMVCESSARYICDMQIYDGKCGPSIEMVGFLFEPYEGKGYHLYQDNYCNSVHQMNELLQNNQSELWITKRHDRRGKKVE